MTIDLITLGFSITGWVLALTAWSVNRSLRRENEWLERQFDVCAEQCPLAAKHAWPYR